MTYQQILNTIAETSYDSGHSGKFGGFRWMNLKTVRDLFKDRMLKMKKAGEFKRKDVNADSRGKNDLVVSKEQLQSIIDQVETAINNRAFKAIKRNGNDNGWSENCFEFLDIVKKDLREIKDERCELLEILKIKFGEK